MEWKGKRVFLTGASSGIGEGLAVALARRGAVLGLVARHREMLEDLAARCGDAGGTARVFTADVTDAAAISDAARAFREEFGKIDILIANAGIGGNDKKTRSYDPHSGGRGKARAGDTVLQASQRLDHSRYRARPAIES